MQKTIGWKDKFQTNKRNQISVLKVWVRLLSDRYRFVQDRLLQQILICATFTVNREFWRCGTICQVYLFCLVKDLNENNSIALYRLVQFLFFVWLFMKKFFSVLLKSGFKEFVPWILKLKYLNASSFQTFYLLWNIFINNQSIIRWTVSPKALRQSKIAPE